LLRWLFSLDGGGPGRQGRYTEDSGSQSGGRCRRMVLHRGWDTGDIPTSLTSLHTSLQHPADPYIPHIPHIPDIPCIPGTSLQHPAHPYIPPRAPWVRFENSLETLRISSLLYIMSAEKGYIPNIPTSLRTSLRHPVHPYIPDIPEHIRARSLTSRPHPAHPPLRISPVSHPLRGTTKREASHRQSGSTATHLLTDDVFCRDTVVLTLLERES
jgi:hypothetical protein